MTTDKTTSHTTANVREQLRIDGHLGPLNALDAPLTLEMSPLTVFIGPQGTGKSLISQLLYFFRDAQYLIANHSRQESPHVTVRKIIEGIRSGENSTRAFSSFVMGNRVKLDYIKNTREETSKNWGVTCHESNRKITANPSFRREIESWLSQIADNPIESGTLKARSIFIPAERSFFSRLINTDPQALGSPDLPITMREFTTVLLTAAKIHQGWQELGEEVPQEVAEIDQIITGELRGRAVFSKRGPYARHWQWLPQASERPIEIEMASSGQMETWPMVSIAQALFSQTPSDRPLFIHIEEPETHLHPSAQVAITKLLAYLCNHGFRLVITTHSLLVLYVLNNLLLADKNLPNQEFPELPNLSQRLSPDQLSAYLFNDGTVTSVFDPDSQEIDESQLAHVLGDLEVEYNQIQAYNVLWS